MRPCQFELILYFWTHCLRTEPTKVVSAAGVRRTRSGMDPDLVVDVVRGALTEEVMTNCFERLVSECPGRRF
jgi:hypothetical protein